MTDWWDDGASPSPGQSTQHPSIQPVAPTAATVDGPPPRSAPGVGRLGANSVVTGVAVGVAAPLAGLAIAGALVATVFAESTRLHFGVRAVAVAVLLGAGLAGWAALTAGQIPAALRRSAIGAITTAGVCALLLPLADWLWRRSREADGVGDLEILIAAWAVIGAAAGAATGLVDGPRRAYAGLLGGFVGGLLGGIGFALASDDFATTQEAGASSILLGFTATSLGIGLGVGVAERIGRTVWLTALDGPQAGREYILYGNEIRMGTTGHCEVYLGPDRDVAPVHAIIHVAGDTVRLRADGGPVSVDGVAHTDGPVAAGSVIRVGSSYVRLEQRP